MDESKRNWPKGTESQVHQGHQALSRGMFRDPIAYAVVYKAPWAFNSLMFCSAFAFKIMSLFILILWRFGFIKGFCC